MRAHRKIYGAEQIAVHTPAHFELIVLQEGLNVLLHGQSCRIRVSIANALEDRHVLGRRGDRISRFTSLDPHHAVSSPELHRDHRANRRGEIRIAARLGNPEMELRVSLAELAAFLALGTVSGGKRSLLDASQKARSNAFRRQTSGLNFKGHAKFAQLLHLLRVPTHGDIDKPCSGRWRGSRDIDAAPLARAQHP